MAWRAGWLAALMGVWLLGRSAAWAAALSRATGCAAFIQMRTQRPDAPGVQAESDALVALLAPYLPLRQSIRDREALVYALVTDAAQWCGQHAQANLGAAIDAATAQARLTARPDGPGAPEVELGTPAPSPATAVPDAVALEAVDVFRRTCLAFSDSAALRAWAAGQTFAAVPAPYVAALTQGAPAVGFYVRAASVVLVVASLDDGACEVAAPHGDVAGFEAALEHAALPPGMRLRVLQELLDPVHNLRQRQYDLEAAAWGQTVIAAPRLYVPAQPGAPMVVLVATPRRAGL